MIVTFKPIIVTSNRRKDGTYSVVIRTTFRGVTRRLPTTLYCTASDITRSGKIKSADILNKAERIVAQMREAIADINPFELEDMDVDAIVAHVKDRLSVKKFRMDFFEWSDRYLKSKAGTTKKAYFTALNALARYLGRREVDINDISRKMLLEFVDYVDAEPRMRWSKKDGCVVPTEQAKPRGQSVRMLAKLEHLYNAAKDKYNDEDSGQILIPRSPFASIKKDYPLSKGQRSVGRETMQRILDCRTDDPLIRTALDLYIVSFALMGANLADLYNARPVRGDVWIYNRQKTASRRADRAEMRVRIPEQIRPHLERLTAGRGGWWLNRAHSFASNKDYCSQRTNDYLRRWCEENGVEPFTFYAARHTWATVARQDCRVDKSTIDDCLGHVGTSVLADIYAEKAWELMQETNAKVLELFNF